MDVDEAEIRRRIGQDAKARRRTRLRTGLLVGTATAVGLPILWRSLADDPWAIIVHYTLVATLCMVLLAHWCWRDRFVAPDAVEVESVEIVAVRGREVAVETQTGRRLRWPIARRAPALPPVGARLWASAPVRRWHRSTLLAADGSAGDGLLVWRPTLEAVAEGPVDAVTVDLSSTPAARARQERIRVADPVQLLADARRRAAATRRDLLLWGGVFTAMVLSMGYVWVTVPEVYPNFGAILLPAWIGLVANRGSIWAARDLARAERLVPVEFEARPFSQEIVARDAAGALYAWRTEVEHMAWPAARSGPGWVTAPLQEGRRVTIVDEGGFVGAISTVRAVGDD